MAFSGGVFTLVSGNPVVTGTPISSTWANSTLSDIANNGLTLCVLKDGSQTITGNIPMNSFKFTGLAAGTGNGDSVRYEQALLLSVGGTISGAVTMSANLTVPDANLLVVGSSDASKKMRFEVDGNTANTTRIVTPQNQNITMGSVAYNYLTGLTMSTAGSSGTMSIAAGQATDSTNVMMMLLASAISKTTSSWAVGSAQGGLDSGSIASGTWYKFFVIMRPDTGVVDVIFSTNSVASGPTLPSNYTLFRYIGSGLTDGSSHWVSFTQFGDLFELNTPVVETTSANPGTSAVTQTLVNVPTGVNVIANTNIVVIGSATNVYISDLATADLAPSNSVAPGQTLGTLNLGIPFSTRTNTSAQIRTRISSSGSGQQLLIVTLGWVDRRGRDS